jgi:hypothetical protein
VLLGFSLVPILPVPGASAGRERPAQVSFHTVGTTYFVAPDGNDSGPGSADRPWATINHAADKAVAGDTVVVHDGRYLLSTQVRPRNSGRPNAWITFVGYPGERPVLDAQSIQQPPFSERHLNNGAFQIEDVSYVRVADLTVINSHDAGFTVRDSSHIELINNATRGTYSSGIAVWDTNHDDKGTERIRILGNTIERATTWDLASPDVPRGGQTPHEALSIGGAVDFEVAYNHVYDSDKEGIDIKETSKRGKVHHNVVDTVDRQGIYVDAWFGRISDIEVFSNVVHDCRGAGVAVSAENGVAVERLNLHDNLVFNNDGSGLYFSRWGVNNPRRNMQISRNIFYHNGYGPTKDGQTYHWQTGGIYLYSANLHDVSISKNIFSENRGFQIGYSELYLKDGRSWQAAARAQNIRISDNLIFGSNATSPIESGGAPFDRVKIYAVTGERPLFGDPQFRNPADQDFALKANSPAIKTKLFAVSNPRYVASQDWWKKDFPPRLVRYAIGGTK